MATFQSTYRAAACSLGSFIPFAACSIETYRLLAGEVIDVLVRRQGTANPMEVRVAIIGMLTAGRAQWWVC